MPDENKSFVRDIKVERGDKKVWVRVYFSDGKIWYPKITEVGKILSGLGKAEDIKYPQGKGWQYLKEFIDSCWGKTRKEIDDQYLAKFDPNGVTKESKKNREVLTKYAAEGWDAMDKPKDAAT